MVDTQTLIAMFALAGLVVVGGALLSGPVERTGLPALAVFLLLGLLIGPAGLGLITIGLDSPILRVVSTLSLTLVLFTDAMTLDLREVRRNARLAALILGPGTLLVALLIGGTAWALLGIEPLLALLLGAAVASTDPVMLRGMLQTSRLGERLRLALRLESGMNDVLLLPIVVIVIILSHSEAVTMMGFLGRLAGLFLLGPLAGAAVGLLAVRLLVWVRARFGVRREYEALYVIGVALSAFAAAEALGGSGFLAAFAAGLVIAWLDLELCDCFLEYGQVTAEMALLFTFVLLGAGPIWSGLGVITPATLALVALAILVRLPIFALALRGMGLTLGDRLTLGWYGPRGLGALLLALLAVFDGLPGGEQIVALASLVVLASIVVHGGWPLTRYLPIGRATAPAPAEIIPLSPNGSLPIRLTLAELDTLEAAGAPVQLIDARTERSFNADELIAAGAIRIPPERAVEAMRASGVPADAWVVAYCT